LLGIVFAPLDVSIASHHRFGDDDASRSRRLRHPNLRKAISVPSMSSMGQERPLQQAQLRAFGRGTMIRKLKNGEYRLYSRKLNPKTRHRRNLGTFKTRTAAERHERAVQFFKRHG
jgi:hypothetical protein